MRNKIGMICLAVVMACCCLSGCGGMRKAEDNFDPTKTNISILCNKGGYGTEWLDVLIAQFEEKYKDVSFEEGKTGVKINVTPGKQLYLDSIDNQSEDIFFVEGKYYDNAIAGKLLDISEIVNGKDSDLSEFGDAAGSTIEKKLSAEQKAAYSAVNGKYYALPHQLGVYGIIYDEDVFEKRQLFFAKDGCPSEAEYKFENGVKTNTKGTFSGTYRYTDGKNKTDLSAGPDGAYGTDDDGLPATWTEFFELMNGMVRKSVIPLKWNGGYYTYYLNWLIASLAADYEGADMKLTFGAQGTAHHLVQSIGGKQNSADLFEEVTLKAETPIGQDNGHEMFRSAGMYYALKVVENIITNFGARSGNYYEADKCFNGSNTQTEAQAEFLESSYRTNTPMAMMVEGNWWEQEAEDYGTFESMKKYGDSASRNKRRLKFLPFPKATNDQIGSGVSLYDIQNETVVAVSSRLASKSEGKRQAVLKFLKFCHSDASLVTYTTVTGAPKSFRYELTDAQLSALSPYSQSVWKLLRKESTQVIYPLSGAQSYLRNQSTYTVSEMLKANIGGKEYNQPTDEFRKKSKSAQTYFDGIGTKYNAAWWSALAK